MGLYEDELLEATRTGKLKSLHLAFSRETSEKVYVQNLMEKEENQNEIWDLIGEKKGYFYICGDANYMAKDVTSALLKVFQTKGNMSESEANNLLQKMRNEHRFQEDTWF